MMERSCIPYFSTLGRCCIKFLESSLSCKWAQHGKCSNSLLTPDWWEPRGRARNHTGHHLGPTINGRKSDNWSSLYLCHHRCQHLPRNSQNFGQIQSSTSHLFELYPLQETNLCWFSSLFSDFLVFCWHFSPHFSSICLIFCQFVSFMASKNGSVVHLFFLLDSDQILQLPFAHLHLKIQVSKTKLSVILQNLLLFLFWFTLDSWLYHHEVFHINEVPRVPNSTSKLYYTTNLRSLLPLSISSLGLWLVLI